jgi:RecJ-like exonuclease
MPDSTTERDTEGPAERCPVCNGMGQQSRPPWVAGDAETWTTGDTSAYPCPACNATGIVRAARTTQGGRRDAER